MVERVGRDIAILFNGHGTRRGEESASRPGSSLPLGKVRYPLYRRLGGPQGRSGRTENLAPHGFDFRTVQPGQFLGMHLTGMRVALIYSHHTN